VRYQLLVIKGIAEQVTLVNVIKAAGTVKVVSKLSRGSSLLKSIAQKLPWPKWFGLVLTAPNKSRLFKKPSEQSAEN